MKTYINYLLENTNSKTFNETVALVAGSYKPPTAGHLYMVEYYSKQADSVLVFISNPKAVKSLRTTASGTIITPEMSKEIWEICLKAYHLTNVQLIISDDGSPIKSMCNYIDTMLSNVNVIIGSSTKDNDASRYNFIVTRYKDNPNINVLNPIDTAVQPYSISNGTPISATDIRNNIDNSAVIKTMLPDKLTDKDKEAVIKILQSGKKLPESQLDCSLESMDETEALNIIINDDILKNATISAYNIGQVIQNDDNKDIPYNPKKFPEKAIDIFIPYQDIIIEIFLNTHTKTWDSNIKYNNQDLKLSPDQMGDFFNSVYYQLMIDKFAKKWPLSDKFFSDLYYGILNKTLSIDSVPQLTEDSPVDKSTSNKDIDGDNKRDFTASGRKIVNFSDNNVTIKKSVYQCWPDPEHPFKWSQWKDWKKIKPLCRIRFYHAGIPYGISLSTLGEERDFKNRGFRGYSLDPSLPPVQWLTSEENQSIMKLTLVNKFIKRCIEKISEYINMTPEEIYNKIEDKHKITLKDVTKTHTCIRKTLNEVIKPRQIDNFKWN